MAKIIVNQLSKSYDRQVLKPCSFELESPVSLAVLGPSGSGKSTLLKAIAGLIAKEGSVQMEDVKRCCVVFDEPKCFEHLSVFENISLGMKNEGYSAAEIEKRVKECAEHLSIYELLEKKPSELSFGQRQRVALARALVREFDLLLMDEPFSGLDILLRKQLLSLLKEMQKQKKFICIYVTHDHRDAKILSDQVLILKDGSVQMMDSYEQCLKSPANDFVKAFLE